MASLDPLREHIRGRARVAVGRVAGPLETELRRTSPRRTGRMASQTRVTPAGPYRLRATVNTPYASYVRSGTAPHVIRPVRGKALTFIWHGRRVFFSRVRHPGTLARPWLALAFDRFGRMVADELRRLP